MQQHPATGNGAQISAVSAGKDYHIVQSLLIDRTVQSGNTNNNNKQVISDQSLPPSRVLLKSSTNPSSSSFCLLYLTLIFGGDQLTDKKSINLH